MSTPSKSKMGELQAGPSQFTSEWGSVEELFGKQRANFGTDVTKTYEWRVDQLDRLTRMLKGNYQRFAEASCKDFKTATQENAFEVSASIATSEFAKSQLKEWMKPVEAPLPKFLAASGRKGIVYREPYGGHFDHLSLQWASCPVVASRSCRFISRQPLHFETFRSAVGDG